MEKLFPMCQLQASIMSKNGEYSFTPDECKKLLKNPVIDEQILLVYQSIYA